ncbi:MAG: pirin family protein [Rhodospirillaceae bacterium]|jgi:quercetin 2,3-dioxygenase|nr:pirin family protein [Rhodospirillaceae bacterium]MBT4426454.1 pirin family protein [Rhodospirillaceae bacterium]MBT5036870.1 pirin family protein [Rhodospirillaceae bacterium]
MKLRSVNNLVPATATSDGAGVKLNRTIGGPVLDNLDPFLLLDEFGSEEGADYIGGFPDHPHRGFETVTYMLNGLMRHEDSTGAGGTLGPGSVQWMTAGRGIVHSEMPQQEEGLMRGFQLWVNLPAVDKMCAPRYQNIEPAEIPEVEGADGVRIRVIAGEVDGTLGAVGGIAVEPTYLDILLPPDTSHSQPVASGHAAFCYVFEGEVSIIAAEDGAATQVPHHTLAILSDGEGVRMRAGAEGGQALLIAGKPLGEPVVRYGPFVMNSREEIQQAIDDYRAGRF